MKRIHTIMITVMLIVILLIVFVFVGQAIRENAKSGTTKNDTIGQEVELPESQIDTGSYETTESNEEDVVDQDVDFPEIQIAVGSYVLAYADELPETIGFRIRGTDDTQYDMEFYTLIDDVEIPIFALNVNDDKGEMVMVYTDENGIATPIAFKMYSPSEDMDETTVEAFYSAQDCVNTLVTSLKVKGNHKLTEEVQVEEQIKEWIIGDYTVSFDDVRMAADIQVDVNEEEQTMVFSTMLTEKTEIFRMHLNAEEGDIVMYASDAAGNRVPIAFDVNPIPEELNEDAELSFYRAQEFINDVMQTVCIQINPLESSSFGGN